MDPELVKQHQAFQKRSLAVPRVSAKPKRDVDSGESESSKKKQPVAKKAKRSSDNSKAGKTAQFDYKTITAVAATSFAALAKIIDHMKKRHLRGDTWSLSLNEILEEVLIFDLSKKAREWLATEALAKNPRIHVDDQLKFIYKPPFKVKGSKSLLALLKRHDLEGKGGVMLSELTDSMPNPEKAIEQLGDEVLVIDTTVNKRKDKVLFYNDKNSFTPVDDVFRGMWRQINIEHLDESKIDEYLAKHGIISMREAIQRKKLPTSGQALKRKPVRRKGAIMHNEHLQDVLQDFSHLS